MRLAGSQSAMMKIGEGNLLRCSFSTMEWCITVCNILQVTSLEEQYVYFNEQHLGGNNFQSEIYVKNYVKTAKLSASHAYVPFRV